MDTSRLHTHTYPYTVETIYYVRPDNRSQDEQLSQTRRIIGCAEEGVEERKTLTALVVGMLAPPTGV